MQQEKEQLQDLIQQLDALHEEAITLEQKFAPAVQQVHPAFRKSAQNLLHYLALRHHDIRQLQEHLAHLGLSSLGRAEGHVLASLQAVRKQLCYLTECAPTDKQLPVSFFENRDLLATHTEVLLGPQPAKRSTRIMVTLPSEAADTYELLPRLLRAGMNCARINCAHDGEQAWLRMIQHVQQAVQETGIPCKILMDLMGPKLRTGPLKEGPKLVVIRPMQNDLGQITEAARVWLAPPGAPPPKNTDAWLPVEAEWLAQLQEGDKLYFKDTRGRKRSLSVIKREQNGCLAHLFKTSYIETGTVLHLKSKTVQERKVTVGELPPTFAPLLLKKDDLMILTKAPTPGESARYNARGHVVQPAHISCTLPEVFSQVKKGQPILFNDGKIEGQIQEVNKNTLLVKITYASEKGSKLGEDKGINLPETKFHMNGLTEKDKQDLRFVAQHADIVNLSFVNNAETVEALHQELEELGAKDLGVMLKIETQEGFRNLPHLLLSVMKRYPAGIMIARGDLAVECGWQRLAEVQEEILWLCEAAHLPAVWATQVLETLAKKGRPSRAEITDAAMAQRADCVMLNKGPHVVQAIEMLHDILTRMQEHQHKKTSMLRSLHVSDMKELQP
ncbi:pyruvate kinase [Pontibacter ummariensis]|uniref:pyruvate kinase n=1 Tax=Pontibacter ummariensis TaxID=1610492 RepID=A0A239DWR9_9BACT|nr:pyruvate kinase [Pontibacter ummariensis]PRY13711.1 pyruvate kinase [Pontibacter ummariensis]SNS36985.1 pyruvate kinase [Pontibacter ummariensis]